MRMVWRAAVAAALSLVCLDGAFAQATVRIGLAVPNNTPYAPIFAAQDLGLFKKAGLDVEITEYRGGAVAQEALTAGAADIITYFAPGAALAISKGAKEKIVGTVLDRPYGWQLLVNANSPLKSLQDLAGKKVGITAKGSTSDLLALWALEKGGIQAQTVPLGSGAIPAMRSGQVDAVAMFPPVTVRMIESGQARSLLDFSREMPPMLPDVWVASQDMMDKHPDQLRAVLAAYYEAFAYMRDHRDWSLKYIADRTSEEPKIVPLVYDLLLQQPSTGRVDEGAVRTALDQAARGWGEAPLGKMAPADVMTNAFLPAAP